MDVTIMTWYEYHLIYNNVQVLVALILSVMARYFLPGVVHSMRILARDSGAGMAAEASRCAHSSQRVESPIYLIY